MLVFGVHDHPQHDLPTLCELDGVADQIEDDLAQAAGVADQAVRSLRGNVARELEPLGVRTHRHGLEGAADAIAETEGDSFQHELASFDLREIQNVIEHGEQRV